MNSRLILRPLTAQLLCGTLLLQLSPAALGIPATAPAEPGTRAATQAPPASPPDPPRRPDRPRPEPAGTTAQPAAAQPGAISLVPGFNLISLPRVPAATDPATIFQPLGDQLDSVYTWDHCGASEAWQVYDPSDPALTNLQALDYRQGLWVDVASATSFLPEGTAPTVTEIPLCAGWNLIGYPLDQPRPVPAALASIAGKYERVFGYDKADAQDPWEVYDPNVPDWATRM